MTAEELLVCPAVPLEWVLHAVGLATSRSDGRRLIAQGAITIRGPDGSAPWRLTPGARYWVVRHPQGGVHIVGVPLAKEGPNAE